MTVREDNYVEVAGHKLIAPVLPDGVKLCRPLKEYFPERDPDVWFAMSVEDQDRWIVESVFGGQCAFLGFPMPGEEVIGHHVVPRGQVKKAARAPWNVIAIMMSPDPERNIHGWFHRQEGKCKQWCIFRYDFLDRDGGLVVADENEERIPNEKLHFYAIPSPDKVIAAQEWLRMIMAEYRQLTGCMYRMGALAVAGDEYATVLGMGTVKACLAQYGIDTGVVAIPRKVLDEMYQFWDQVMDACVPPRIVDMLRKLPDNLQAEWVAKAIDKCAPLDFTKEDKRHPSIPDFIEELKEAFPPEQRPTKVSIVPLDTPVHTKEVDDVDDPGEEGIVFRGEPVNHS